MRIKEIIVKEGKTQKRGNSFIKAERSFVIALNEQESRDIGRIRQISNKMGIIAKAEVEEALK